DDQGAVYEDRRGQVGQQFPEQDARAARAHAAGRLDELPLAQRERLSADDAADVRPAEEPDDEDQHTDADRGLLRQYRDQRDREQQQRERQEDVHRPADQAVDPTAEVSGDDAQDDAEYHGDQRGQERHQQRDPGAVDDLAEH